MTEKELQLSLELIREKIYVIRGQKVMLDKDLAILYGVLTRNLNKAVKRNIDRFPDDFMFQLNKEEMNLMFQTGTSKKNHGGVRKLANVFTEQGIAMLSTVLNSKRAIQVNIQIMRLFVKIRELMSVHKDIYKHLNRLEAKQATSDRRITKIDTIIEEMLKLPVTLKRKNKPIGFRKK
ncbi:ORF6N domain-containing protein [bacterium]|nr:ORF6N domain-containing protein [bacterium]